MKSSKQTNGDYPLPTLVGSPEEYLKDTNEYYNDHKTLKNNHKNVK